MAVTAICAPEAVAHGGMRTADPLAVVERRLMTIATAENVRVFGGLDISSNEHRQLRFQPHYMPHAHHLVSAVAFDHHHEKWTAHFPEHDLATKPILSKTYNGKRRWLAYCLHPIIDRRDSEEAYVSSDGTRKRANTRDKPMRRPQRLELALMLDRVGIEARIITYGYDVLTDGRDVWMEKVDRRRADELLAERERRRATRRDEHHRREREHLVECREQRFRL